MSWRPLNKPANFFGNKLTERQFLTRRTGLLLTGGLIAVVGAASYLQGDAESSVLPEESALPMPVAVASLSKSETFHRERDYAGTVVARRTSDLSFEQVGRLERIHVQEGEPVDAGQLLAELDTNALQAQRRELEAQLAEAEAVLAERLAGPREEKIVAARAEVRRLTAMRNLDTAQLKRMTTLRRSKTVTEEEYDQARFGLDATSAQLEFAETQLEELLNGTRQEQIDSQRAVVGRLQASIERIDVDLAKSRLTAPFAGRIASRMVDEGTIVSIGSPILRLVEQQALEAWIGLPAATIAHLDLEAPHDLRSAGRDWKGTQGRLLPELDPATRTRTVVFDLPDDAEEILAPGQTIRLKVREEIAKPGFWLPVTALIRGTRGLWSCYAVMESPEEDSILQRRDVEILHTDGEQAFVRGTLSDGELIVTAGTHRLVAGQRVTVMDPSGNWTP